MQRFKNNPSTTLSAAISSTGATTCTVTSASSFPVDPDFQILIDNEIMRVTAISGTTFTIVRAEESTTAATHLIAATVTGVLTAKSLLNRDWFDVRAYGARGNGTTEDTAAIHAARDAAGTWGTLFFPDGTYLCGPLSMSIVGQKWFLSRNAIIKTKPGASDALQLSAADTLIEGGTIDHDKVNQTAGSAVWIHAARAKVRSVNIKNSKSNGVYGTGSDAMVVEKCVIQDQGTNGIFFENNATNGIVRENRITGMNAATTYHNIAFHATTSGQSVSGARILDNYCEQAGGFSIEVGAFGGNRPKDILIRGNQTVSTANGFGGISMDTTDDSVCANNTYTDNGFTQTISAIELPGATEVSVVGNTIRGSKTRFPLTLDRSSRCSVVGNIFKGWDYALNGSAIHLATSAAGERADDNVISGNSFIADTSNNFRAIWVQANAATGSCDRNVISNNVFVGTGAGAAIWLSKDNGTLDSTIISANSYTGWGTKVGVNTATNTINVNGN